MNKKEIVVNFKEINTENILKRKLLLYSILTAFLLLLSFELMAKKPIVAYYRGGKAAIKLVSFPANINYKIVIEGKSKFKYLLAQLDKKHSGKNKQISFQTKSDGTFHKEILLRWGKGKYNLTIYGNSYNHSGNYQGLMKVEFFAKGQLPEKINKFADIEYYSAAGNFKLKNTLKKVGYILSLSGFNGKYKRIQLNITKEKTNIRKEPVLILNENENFSVKYLLKNGQGKYNIMVFGSQMLNSSSLTGLAKFSIYSGKNIPEGKKNIPLNRKILEFVNSKLGKTVGRGECWDLAQEPLDLYGADWIRPVNFGRSLNPRKDKILPGDIIQFRSVRIVSKKGNITTTTSIGSPDHTSIIYKVLGKNKYRLAEQNVGNTRKVVIDTLDLNNITSGKYWIFRPIKAFVE